MSSSTCQYSFDPSKWEQEGSHPAALDTKWTCSREVEADTDYCKFHLSAERRTQIGIDDAAINEAFLEELKEDDDKSVVRFVGANFGKLDISHEVIGRSSNKPIDLRYVTICGGFNAEQAVIQQPLLMDEATIEGGMDFTDAELGEDVKIRRARINGDAVLENTNFGDDCLFSHTTFHEIVNFDQVRFSGSADFYNSQFEDNSRFIESEWMGGCRFQRAQFRGVTNFLSSQFHSRTDFRNAQFKETARFSRSSFDDETLFIDCVFGAGALFKKVQYSEAAYYQSVNFRSETSFTESNFEDKAKFHFTKFNGEASISYVRFADATYFKNAKFKDYASFYESAFQRLVDFRKVRFSDTARFMKAEFEDEVFFDQATFVGDGDFRNSIFLDSSYFVETEFHSGANMKNTQFKNAVFRNIGSSRDSLTIDMESARIDAGNFVQRDDVSVYYNLRDGLIGDVEIQIPESYDVFERFFIYRTDFEGFDFSDYRYFLTPDWALHTFAGATEYSYDLEANRFALEVDIEASTNTREDKSEKQTDDFWEYVRTGDISSRIRDRFVNPAAPDLEVTYLKAKNGANKVGDSQGASRFFIKEMRYRRQAHLNRVFIGSEHVITRLKLLLLVAMNLTMALTCGYGEKPRRTIGFSLFTIGVYALIFPTFIPEPPFGSPFGYLLLSIQSFTSLLFGHSANLPGFAGSFLVATEGFVGAFMIGLFIFALTRSVHR